MGHVNLFSSDGIIVGIKKEFDRISRINTSNKAGREVRDEAISEILVPVDGSQESLRAVRLAGEIALIMHATLYILYVSPFDESTDEGDVPWLPESIVRSAAKEAREIFAPALALLPAEVLYERIHCTGAPADVILRFIDREHIGLVVLGGRKRSRVSGFLLGSVTQSVLEHAHSSVMVAGSAEYCPYGSCSLKK